MKKSFANKRRVFLFLAFLLLCCVGAVALLLLSHKKKEDETMNIRQLFRNKDEIVIDCLGDSITWGMYSTPQLEEDIASGQVPTGFDDGGQLFEDVGIFISKAYQSTPSYPEVLESRLNEMLQKDERKARVTVVNDGICGDWITKTSYRRMTCEPDVAVILFGGNNYYFDIPIEGTLEANIKALQEQGILIYLANYPLYPNGAHEEDFLSANKYLAQVAKEENLPLIDVCDVVDACVAGEAESKIYGSFSRKDLFSPDKIHLSEAGYMLIGQIIADAVYQDIR